MKTCYAYIEVIRFQEGLELGSGFETRYIGREQGEVFQVTREQEL